MLEKSNPTEEKMLGKFIPTRGEFKSGSITIKYEIHMHNGRGEDTPLMLFFFIFQ